MHGDTTSPESDAAWEQYFTRMHASGVFRGGSSIGKGECLRKADTAAPLSRSLVGYIKLEAASLAEAKAWVVGNPVYEAGGSVELRELPGDG